jgi:hypothetical protein
MDRYITHYTLYLSTNSEKWRLRLCFLPTLLVSEYYPFHHALVGRKAEEVTAQTQNRDSRLIIINNARMKVDRELWTEDKSMVLSSIDVTYEYLKMRLYFKLTYFLFMPSYRSDTDDHEF